MRPLSIFDEGIYGNWKVGRVLKPMKNEELLVFLFDKGFIVYEVKNSKTKFEKGKDAYINIFNFIQDFCISGEDKIVIFDENDKIFVFKINFTKEKFDCSNLQEFKLKNNFDRREKLGSICTDFSGKYLMVLKTTQDHIGSINSSFLDFSSSIVIMEFNDEKLEFELKNLIDVYDLESEIFYNFSIFKPCSTGFLFIGMREFNVSPFYVFYYDVDGNCLDHVDFFDTEFEIEDEAAVRKLSFLKYDNSFLTVTRNFKIIKINLNGGMF